MNTTEERKGCGFAAMQAVHDITQALKDFWALILCQCQKKTVSSFTQRETIAFI